jgi:Family of unknown function (DUF6492)
MPEIQLGVRQKSTTDKLSFAIVTPSYAPDYERCRLLSWSISQFVSPAITHYIVVDRRDLQLFNRLKKPNTEIITVESLIPWWIQRVPFLKNGWFSLKTPPIRNWLLQQIVKNAIAEYVPQDILVFADSDTALIRPLNLNNFTRDGRVRLFREPGVDTDKVFLRWHRTSHQLLSLPRNLNSSASGFIGNFITWKRDNVLKLHRHLEKISGRSWVETLASCWHLSEYILYGEFIEKILKEESGHYFDSEKICHEYWNPQLMTQQELQKFFTKINPKYKAIMISAKAGISVGQYENLLKSVPVP